MAQFYHITDWRVLPLQTAATLVLGLPESSRVKRGKKGLKTDLDTLLLAVIADRLGLLVYSKTKAAKAGANKPNSIASVILGGVDEPERPAAFETPEAFWAARDAALGKS